MTFYSVKQTIVTKGCETPTEIHYPLPSKTMTKPFVKTNAKKQAEELRTFSGVFGLKKVLN